MKKLIIVIILAALTISGFAQKKFTDYPAVTTLDGSGLLLVAKPSEDTIRTITMSNFLSGYATYPAAGIALSSGSGWSSSITNNSANWNTAFGWGDHSAAGYLLKTDTTAMLTNYLLSSEIASSYATIDNLNLKLNAANGALTGNTTAEDIVTEAFTLGTGNVELDDIKKLGTGELAIFDGADTLVPYIPYSARSTNDPLLQEITENAQVGTTYTLVLTDAAKRVTCTNAGAITLTVPPNSSVAFPVGTQIIVEQWGAGAITFAEGSGVTIRSLGGDLISAGQYGVFYLKKDAEDVWILSGDL